MGVAYLEVEYEIGGRPYRTVHGAQCDTDAILVTFSEDDLINFGGDLVGDVDFENATDPAVTTQEPRSIIEAILYFHRHMQGVECTIKKLNINDGATPGSQTGNYASIPLDLQCRGNQMLTGGDLAGLNNTLMITKTPVGFSKRPGRMKLRGAIRNIHISHGDADGVIFLPGFRALYNYERLEATLGVGLGISTRLASYMSLGAPGAIGDNVRYVIPNTSKFTSIDPETGETITKRWLTGFTPVKTTVVTDAASHNTRRRGKKK